MIQVADSGVATAAVGIPQRNMHTQVEIVSLEDIEHTIRLLVEFIGRLRADADLRPINFDDAAPTEPQGLAPARRLERQPGRDAKDGNDGSGGASPSHHHARAGQAGA